MGERGTYQGRPCTRHTDVLALFDSLYCYYCDRLRDNGCRCHNPDPATTQRRVPHARAVKAAETNQASRARLAELIAASKPPPPKDKYDDLADAIKGLDRLSRLP